jgi:hypothetical protein
VSRQRLRASRVLAVLVSLCLLSASIAPTLSWGCEGGSEELYEGKETGKEIAGGNSTHVGTGFEFDNLGEKQAVTCEETYTWGNQGPARTFVLTPSYANCKYKGANVPAITVGAACRYQLNPPVLLGVNKWEATLSIIGAGCELKMELEAGACKVKVKNEAANEGLNKVSESNQGNNLRAIPVVSPIKYTSAGCALPISAAGAILTYASEQEIGNVNIR